MDQKSILEIKASFAEDTFKNPSVLYIKDITKEALILYDICLKSLQKCKTCKVIDCSFDIGRLNTRQNIKFHFSLDKYPHKIIIKVKYLMNEGVFLLNCFNKFGKQWICQISLEEPQVNESLDSFIFRSSKKIMNVLTPSIMKLNQMQGKQGIESAQQQLNKSKQRMPRDVSYNQPFSWDIEHQLGQTNQNIVNPAIERMQSGRDFGEDYFIEDVALYFEL